MIDLGFRRWGIWICLIFVTVSCIDQLEFDTQGENSEFFVINGIITNDEAKRSLFLFRTEGFEAGNLVRASEVTGAEIHLFEDGEEVEAFMELPEGEYEIPVSDRTRLKEGRSYHVEISLPNGEKYQSTPTVIPPNQAPDSMRVTGEIRNIAQDNGFVVSRRFLDLSIFNTLTPGVRPYFRWEIEQDYSFQEYTNPNVPLEPTKTCYFNREVTRNPSPILKTSPLEDGQIETFLLSSPFGRFFKDVHYFSVYQHSISEEVYEYYEKVDQLVNGTGGIFDQIPAPIVGNIVNAENTTQSVLGVVEFSTVDTLRFRISRGELPFALYEVCETFEDPLPECYECITISRASYEKPDFFVD